MFFAVCNRIRPSVALLLGFSTAGARLVARWAYIGAQSRRLGVSIPWYDVLGSVVLAVVVAALGVPLFKPELCE